ncbi:hypothetical protein BKH43_06005 [Helicobacter sp. 13S00401-1]|uniref:c-type cytochrome n=1 Tax=Helicobacter sp. 13S00401-1 TaxID=1905758 RepID=UPI000BDDDB43|nr:c-type cytochrome [Helicobacter sp. 13S00401-1]PAF50044.1 hypothetical protein BKH43_06005 [Helicobacter sp. 13S00401-1]
MKKKLLTTIVASSVAALMLSTTVAFASGMHNGDKKENDGKIMTKVKAHGDTMEWRLPPNMDKDGNIDFSKIPDGAYKEGLKYGQKIFNETYGTIGDGAHGEGKGMAKSKLSCASCHGLGGASKNTLSLVGAFAHYPESNYRGPGILNIEDRINACMVRSENGKPLPVESKEMKAMVAYLYFLSKGVPVGTTVLTDYSQTKVDVSKPGDAKKGKLIFADKCAACHGINGEGTRNPDKKSGNYFIYPALWGKDAYNSGAGMQHLDKLAKFIKLNMPKGNATLTEQEALDVATYIHMQPKPKFMGK